MEKIRKIDADKAQPELKVGHATNFYSSLKDPKNYISKPWFDWLFFLSSPLWAIAIIYFAKQSTIFNQNAFYLFGNATIGSIIFGGLTMAHLFAVFFRSHANPKIFRQFKYRFFAIPVYVFIAINLSTWFLVITSVLITWWDVYHSGLQTFGLGRIYDSRIGNPPKLGRKLDIIMNHLTYMGPILAGANMMSHVEDFSEFEQLDARFFTSIPSIASANSAAISIAIISFGLVFTVFYLAKYYSYYKQGYQISPQKVVLYSATFLTSIACWGFSSFGAAFLIMNLFHAVQYFAIVWWAEGKNMSQLFSPNSFRGKKIIAVTLFLGISFLYGSTSFVIDNSIGIAVFHTVSLMHFWYDGFIWSVQQKAV